MAAKAPNQLSPVATSMNGANVKFTWTLADQPSYSNGGQAITAYEVLFLSDDGTTFAGESTYCPSSAAILGQMFFEIPMSELTSSTGAFKLTLGKLI